MEFTEVEELNKIIESAQHGYWLPFAIMATAWSIIIGLLIYIYNKNNAGTDKRLSDNEQLTKELAVARISDSQILKELQTIIKYHEKSIDEIKQR
jgi:hypothetical protein